MKKMDTMRHRLARVLDRYEGKHVTPKMIESLRHDLKFVTDSELREMGFQVEKRIQFGRKPRNKKAEQGASGTASSSAG